jgi:hypothetical protein
MAPDAALTAAPRHGVADHPHDPGTAGPVRLDVLGRLFGMQFPDSVSPVLLLMIRCRERAPAFSLELATDLAVEAAGLFSRSGGRRPLVDGSDRAESLADRGWIDKTRRLRVACFDVCDTSVALSCYCNDHTSRVHSGLWCETANSRFQDWICLVRSSLRAKDSGSPMARSAVNAGNIC